MIEKQSTNENYTSCQHELCNSIANSHKAQLTIRFCRTIAKTL